MKHQVMVVDQTPGQLPSDVVACLGGEGHALVHARERAGIGVGGVGRGSVQAIHQGAGSGLRAEYLAHRELTGTRAEVERGQGRWIGSDSVPIHARLSCQARRARIIGDDGPDHHLQPTTN